MSIHAHHPADTTSSGATRRRPWTVLAVHLGESDLQAVVTAYLMCSGGGLLLGGRIADLLTRRTVFLSGLALFVLASLASGFADSAAQLVTTRAIQGMSAAVLTPSALSLIMTTYDGDQRRTGLALWGVVGSLGVAAGVVVGGALTTWVSWQLIFWINVPIGLVALVAGLHSIPRVARTGTASLRRFDLPGAALAIGGLSALVLALSDTSTLGWTSARTIMTFAVSAALLAGFVAWERRAGEPLFPPHVWKVRTLVSGTAVMLGITGILVGTVFLASILLQAQLGLTALQAGLGFLPFALAITVGAVLARHAMAHVAPRAVAFVGLVVTAGAAALLAAVPADASYAADLLPGLVALGVGVGLVFAPVSITAMAGIPESHAGLASGFLMTGHEVGAALGVAVLSAAANAAGSLTDPTQVVDAFSRGMLVAGVTAGALAVLAWLRLPSARIEGGAGMHMHH
jgi:EmrB/QacA subfamily drug resistance transporter